MKIRTEEEFQDEVDKETSWRKKELFAIKSNIETAKNSARETALRAGIALLYAHWEGLIKNIATYYLCYVSFQKHTYAELKPNFLALSIKEKLRGFEESNRSTRHNQIIRDVRELENQKSKIPYENIIKTNSNLKSDIFIEIMETIGLDYSSYCTDFVLLDETLLKMRNEIAHGEYTAQISLDKDRFNEIYQVITKMMNMFVNQVCNAVVQKEYLKK